MKLPVLTPSLKRLTGYLLPYKTKIALAVLCMFVAGGSSSLIATLLGQLTDIGFYQREAWIVLAAPIGLILISFLHGGSMFMSNYLLGKVSQSILHTMRQQIFHQFLRWPVATYATQTSGAIASKFVLEANVALSNATKSVITLVRDSCQVIALSAVLFWHNWQLALITIAMAPCIYWLVNRVKGQMRKVMASCQESIASILVRVKEAYQSQRLIKLANTYQQETRRFEKVNEDVQKMMVDMTKVMSAVSPIAQFISMSGVAVVLSVAMYQTHLGTLTLGEFVTFLSALLLLMPPLRNLTEVNTGFVMMNVAAESIFDSLDRATESDTGTEVLRSVRGDMEFKHVSLTYPGSQTPAVKDFTLRVRAGACIALVGLSGSGKSSLVNMIPRFWNPTEGEITIDGINTQNVTLASLRSHIAIVSQDVRLFDESIRYNVTYGTPGATDVEIWAALKAAALDDFVQSLPDGLETKVGEGGSRLSGGQKQRLSIARALLKNAPILILDEATSALDSESEAKIKVALTHLMRGRTTFIVAHRLSTIENATTIVAMQNGVIAEMGSPEELLAHNGVYAQLRALQGGAESAALNARLEAPMTPRQGEMQ